MTDNALPISAAAHNHAPVDPANAYVLVVEDNIQNFVLIARLMAFLGVKQCQWKASGWQVLEFADSMPRVDLILMDIHLPYEDGFEALARLRNEPRFRDTMIVASQRMQMKAPLSARNNPALTGSSASRSIPIASPNRSS